ncbi:MAG: sodium ion-translocating decarboxylase subunit beta, partial [Spirochaetota bacterium]
MSAAEVFGMLSTIFTTSGLMNITWQLVIMWIIGLTFIYLAIGKNFEPLLLLPIGFGIFLVN